MAILSREVNILGLRGKEWVALLVIMIAYFMLSSQYIESIDDTMYSYVHTDISDKRYDWSNPVDNLPEAITSQLVDYKNWNGRFFSHTLVQLFCGLKLGSTLVPFLSSIFLGIILICVQLLTLYTTRKHIGYLPIILAIAILIPNPGGTWLGNISFQVNYLWTSAITLICLYTILECGSGYIQPRLQKITLPFLFLIAGAMHEGFSIPLSAFFLLWLIYKRGKTTKSIIFYIILYWIGTLLVITAPANFVRLDKVTGDSSYLSELISRTITIVRDSWLITIILILSAYLVLRKKEQSYLRYAPYFIIAAVALLFDMFVAFVGEHQLIPIFLMEIVIINSLYAQQYDKLKTPIKKYGTAACIIAMWGAYGAVFHYRQQWDKEWDELHSKIYQTSDKVVEAEDLYSLKHIPYILRSYTQADNALRHVTDNSFFVKLSSVIATDGKEPNKISSILPATRQYIIEAVKNSEPVASGIYPLNDFLIIESKEQDSLCTIEYSYYPTPIGQLLYNLNLKQPVIERQDETTAHSFINAGKRYSIIYLNSKTLKTIKRSDNR